jgi:hypothetical protein
MRYIMAFALFAVGCSDSPLAPSPAPITERITGTSIIIDSRSGHTCITDTLPQARKDPNTFTGTLGPGAQLELRDQFGDTFRFAGTIAGTAYDLFATKMDDPFAWGCQMTEHVVKSELLLTRVGNSLTGRQTTLYDLQYRDGSRVGDTVEDVSTMTLTVIQ